MIHMSAAGSGHRRYQIKMIKWWYKSTKIKSANSTRQQSSGNALILYFGTQSVKINILITVNYFNAECTSELWNWKLDTFNIKLQCNKGTRFSLLAEEVKLTWLNRTGLDSRLTQIIECKKLYLVSSCVWGFSYYFYINSKRKHCMLESFFKIWTYNTWYFVLS